MPLNVMDVHFRSFTHKVLPVIKREATMDVRRRAIGQIPECSPTNWGVRPRDSQKRALSRNPKRSADGRPPVRENDGPVRRRNGFVALDEGGADHLLAVPCLELILSHVGHG